MFTYSFDPTYAADLGENLSMLIEGEVFTRDEEDTAKSLLRKLTRRLEISEYKKTIYVNEEEDALLENLRSAVTKSRRNQEVS